MHRTGAHRITLAVVLLLAFASAAVIAAVHKPMDTTTMDEKKEAATVRNRPCMHHLPEEEDHGYGRHAEGRPFKNPPRDMRAQQVFTGTEVSGWMKILYQFGTCRIPSEDANLPESNQIPAGADRDCGVCWEEGQEVSTFLSSSTVTCTAEDVMTQEKLVYAVNLFRETLQFFGTAINLVQSFGGDVQFSANERCGSSPGVQFGSGVLGEYRDMEEYTNSVLNPRTLVNQRMFLFDSAATGRNTYVIVTFGAVRVNSTTSHVAENGVAWASACRFESATGRPVVIHLNVNPAALDNARPSGGDYRSTPVMWTSDMQFRADLEGIIHELTHAIGFRTDIFNTLGYLNLDNTYSGSGSTSIFRSFSSVLRKSVSSVITPRVRDAMEAYYGCAVNSEVRGMEVEDYQTSVGLHWEARVALDEMMTFEQMTLRRFWSNLTAQFLADTGFYTVRTLDPGVTGPMNTAQFQNVYKQHGRQKGCTFLTSRCLDQPENGFCFDAPDTTVERCTSDRLGRGYCGNIDRGQVIPTLGMRYFTSPSIGGLFEAPDYCPVPVPYADKACVDPTNSDAYNVFFNQYGGQSRCFDSTAVVSGFSASTSSTRCFQISCDSFNPPIFSVRIGSAVTINCTQALEGVVQDLSRLSTVIEGTLTCPAFTDVCSNGIFRHTSRGQVGRAFPVLKGRTVEFTPFVPVSTGFTARTDCSTRLGDCFAPALDAAWGAADCSEISRAWSRCFATDCIDTANSHLAEASATTHTGRALTLFRNNCSNGANTYRTQCPTAPTADIASLCMLGNVPSSAPVRGTTTVALATLFATAAWLAI